MSAPLYDKFIVKGMKEETNYRIQYLHSLMEYAKENLEAIELQAHIEMMQMMQRQ